MRLALEMAKVKPFVIDYDDPEYVGDGELLGEIEYEDFVSAGHLTSSALRRETNGTRSR